MKNKRTQEVIANVNLEVKKGKSYTKDIKEGEKVRIRIPNTKFTRGFHPRWGDVETIDKRIGSTVYIDGKRHKIVDVQRTTKNKKEVAGKALKEALREDKVKRVLRAEGVSESNIVTRNKSARLKTSFDESLVGRKVKRGGVVGKIALYDEEPPYHWFSQWENGNSEYFNKKEAKLYLI